MRKKQEGSYVNRCAICGKKFRKKEIKTGLGGTTSRITWECGCSKGSARRIYRMKSYKEPVGFFKDGKGRDVAVDKKGQHFDPSETRYDLERDPYGWKATGKKVREETP